MFWKSPRNIPISIEMLVTILPHYFQATASPDSRNQQWRTPESNEAINLDDIPKKGFESIGSRNEINQKRIVDE